MVRLITLCVYVTIKYVVLLYNTIFYIPYTPECADLNTPNSSSTTKCVRTGTLKCCGSSLYLKNLYGVGYNIVLEKVNPSDFNSVRMNSVICSYIPQAQVITDAGSEITFQLPLSSSHSFQALFKYIDDNDIVLGKLLVYFLCLDY